MQPGPVEAKLQFEVGGRLKNRFRFDRDDELHIRKPTERPERSFTSWRMRPARMASCPRGIGRPGKVVALGSPTYRELAAQLGCKLVG